MYKLRQGVLRIFRVKITALWIFMFCKQFFSNLRKINYKLTILIL